jgi:hypothetical protein
VRPLRGIDARPNRDPEVLGTALRRMGSTAPTATQQIAVICSRYAGNGISIVEFG